MALDARLRGHDDSGGAGSQATDLFPSGALGNARQPRRLLTSTPLEFQDPAAKRVAFGRQGWASPLSRRQYLLEVWREVGEARAGATVEVGSAKYHPANLIKQDCASAHEAGLKRGVKRHFCAAGLPVGRKAVERFHLRVAGERDGRLPDGVHPSGNDLAV